jgi:hypothetical protein
MSLVYGFLLSAEDREGEAGDMRFPRLFLPCPACFCYEEKKDEGGTK